MKKLSAIILALMLVMSMLPTAFAEGETVRESVTYKFNSSHFVDPTTSAVYATKQESLGWDPTNTGISDNPKFDMRSVIDYGNHGWKFFDVDNAFATVAGRSMRATEVQTTKSRIRPNYVSGATVYWAQQDVNVGLNLKAPAAGLWLVSTSSMNTESGTGGVNPKVRLYLAPVLEEETNQDRVLNYTRDDSLMVDTDTHSSLENYSGRITRGTTLTINKVIYSDNVTDLALIANVYTDSEEEKHCQLNFNTLVITPIEASEISLNAEKTSLMKDESTSLAVTAAKYDVLNSFVTYTSSAPGVATVSADGTVNAISKGKTTITATVGELSKSVEIEVKEDDEELKGAFDYTEEDFTTAPLSTATVNTFTATLGESKNGEDASTDVTSKTVNLGETCTVEAPAAEEGYKFLYWAKGLSTDRKQIVSYNESYSFIPTVESTYLIAVYEPISGESSVNKAEFYNANGQLIETLTANGTAPALPEMAGYENCQGWALYGTNDVIAAGDSVEVSGVKVYVAKFGNPKTVEVNGKDVAYGDKVSFTAAPKAGEIFKAWKKDDVIVSTSETYEFYAWETCTVSPVYVTEEFTFTGIARKILIDTFTAGDKTAVMAEFIGFEDAVEKGIMLGDKRYAMTTDASQFTIVNDDNATEIKGYAIFKDGTIVYDK